MPWNLASFSLVLPPVAFSCIINPSEGSFETFVVSQTSVSRYLVMRAVSSANGLIFRLYPLRSYPLDVGVAVNGTSQSRL